MWLWLDWVDICLVGMFIYRTWFYVVNLVENKQQDGMMAGKEKQIPRFFDLACYGVQDEYDNGFFFHKDVVQIPRQIGTRIFRDLGTCVNCIFCF